LVESKNGDFEGNGMKRLHPLVTLCCLTLAAPLVAALPQEPAGNRAGRGTGDWIALFDGKSLQGWRGYRQTDASQTRWAVQDGTLTLPARTPGAAPRSRDIITTETFDRFELTWEWKVSPGGNSGVKYFVLEDNNSAIGHEYQIIDDARHADAKVGAERQTASFYDVLPPANRTIRQAGEWNTSRIVVRGQTVEHYLNDGKVLTYELGSPALAAAIKDSKFNDVARFGKLQKGHILLQDHGDQVWYRNIRIRRLASES
jgi:hypothetical protein